MSRDISNDNDAARDGCIPQPDPHGLAALLLVESLIHALVARATIDAAEAIEVVSVASEVEAVMLADDRHSAALIERSAALLDAIARSLAGDVPGGKA